MSGQRKCIVGAMAIGMMIAIGGAAGLHATGHAGTAYGTIPLSFEINEGQADPHVKFVARGSGYTVSLTPTEAILALSRTAGKSETIRMSLVGANTASRVEGRDALPGKTNYFIGNDPAKWHTNVATYKKVSYAAVYPGIDLVYYGNQRQLEYDFIVGPGADPHAIEMSFSGARGVKIDADGSLVLSLAQGEVRQPVPFVYQTKGDVRMPVAGHYVITNASKHLVAFEIGRYDAKKPLVIDPTLGYATYLGGSSAFWDAGYGIAVDAAGNAYVSGFTTSGDFPGSGGGCDQTFGLVYCNFVTKINPSGTAILYTTVLGFSNDLGLAVDAAGNAYVAGGASGGFPIVNGFQPYWSGNLDGMMAKLGPTGNLLYSTFIGGGGNDEALGIAADATGHAYVVGFTNSGSNGLPTTSNGLLTYNPSNGCPGGGFTGFLIRINTNASGPASLEYSTNLGGAGDGISPATGVAVDNAGNAYVSGSTTSNFFPTTAGTIEPGPGVPIACWTNAKAYVVKINTAPATCTGSVLDGTFVTCTESLVYGTYLGGSSDNAGNGIAIDAAGNAAIVGSTASTDFPTTAGAAQGANAGGYDAYVAKLDATASTLLSSTYLGGSADDFGTRVALDASGNMFATGSTGSANFPTTADALQATFGGGANDAFVAKLTGGALTFSTFFGGSDDDHGNDISVDANGNAYITGYTLSSNLATTSGSIQPALAGSPGQADAFVAKIAFAAPTPQQQIQTVSDSIATLPGITGGAVSSADAKLTAALTSLANGNTGAAVNQLHALTNQIHALINSHRVSASDGQAVIDAVNGVIVQITQ